MIELSNGCICCTLREDLLTSLSTLAAENRFDHVLIESSGISEPLPVAETFTFRDKATGLSLNDVASLHNLVTVVDAASIFEQLSTVDTLVDRGWHEVEGDKRTVAHLLVDQLEFANLLLINKRDLVTAEQLGAVEAFLRKVNPTAEIMRSEHSVLPPPALLNSARFNMQKAEEHPHWLKEARENEHTPETLEYGISSFIFRAKRPFHPERLHATLGRRPLPGALASLLRLKGFAWLATWRTKQAHAALAGTQFTMAPGNPWWAAIPRQQWPDGLAEDIQDAWDVQHGDRRTELVCIGRELDSEAANAQLEACLLTAEEMAAGEESWRALTDPFATQGSPDAGLEIVSGVTEANTRKFMGMTSAEDYDEILGFMFDTLGEESWLQGDREHVLKQIKECAPALRELFAASADKRRTQQAFLNPLTLILTLTL